MTTQAVILVGGEGTRIRALYPELPKALIPVAGRPFLAWQLAYLAQSGVDHVHLAAGYRADVLADWLARYASPFVAPGTQTRVRVTLSVEPRPLGTGGGLRHAAAALDDAPFWMLNGDSLVPGLDLAAMDRVVQGDAARDTAPPPAAVIAVVPVPEAGQYGVVEFDTAHRITSFREKAAVQGGWVNAGIYHLTPAAVAGIPRDQPISLEREIFPLWAEKKLLRAYPAPPPLLDMGTPEGLRRLQQHLRSYG